MGLPGAAAVAEADVLVVGAGLAGATAARALAHAGRRVAVLDKGRGPGGRLSTRRAGGGGFDHGAATLQAVGPDFRGWLDDEARAGRAHRHADGWVGVPGMNALVAGLLHDLGPRWSTPVAALARSGGLWMAHSDDGVAFARAPCAVLAVPAPQARSLLMAGRSRAPIDGPGEADLDALADALASVRYAPCWAGLLVVDDAIDGTAPASPTLDAAADLSAVFREADKPGRQDAGHWVVHATAGWSEANLECPADRVAPRLREAFIRATGIDGRRVRSVEAHRWRYARPVSGLGSSGAPSVAGLYLAGDAFPPPGVPMDAPPAEVAWCSGRDAAARCLRLSTPQPKS